MQEHKRKGKRNMTKGKKKWLLIAVIIIVVVMAAVVTTVCIVNSRKSEETVGYARDVDDVEVAAMYRCKLGENTSIDYLLDDGTFDNQVNGNSFATGTYSVEANELTLTSEGTDKKYVLDGQYLIPEECFFTGTIPEKEAFDAEVTYDTGEENVTLTFRKDGTFTYVSESEEDGTTTVEGTYERDGSLLKRYEEDGDEMVTLYIYDGHLASLYYVETEAAEEE